MARFSQKPIVIEAVRARHLINDATNNWPGLPDWFRAAYEQYDIFIRSDCIEIRTLEGRMTAAMDDWIIRGVQGELYPCKDGIFRATYDLVE